METIRERFQSFEKPLFEHMSWMDPKVWEDEMNENESLEHLANHFKVTLEKTSFQRQKLIPEWKLLKIYVKSHFQSKLIRGGTNVRKIWNDILLYVRKNFSMYISSFKFALVLQAQMLQQNVHSTF